MISPMRTESDRDPRSLVVSISEPHLREAVGEVEGATIVEWDLTAPAPGEIDIVVQPYMSAPALLAHVAGTGARLVQGTSIGYDGVADHLPEGVPFANAASVHETSTAELAVGMILALQRGIPDFVRAAGEGRWASAAYPSLADRSVLVLGYGGVGKAIARRLEPFEVELVPVARTARVADGVRIRAFDELDELLPQADIVVLAVPLGEHTRRLVDAAFLARMRDGAMLVNMSRGPVVVTDDLTREVASGRLRAAVDVTDPEPLPADHPLWKAPGVLITPHVGGRSSAMTPRMAAVVREQIARMRRGEEPVNVVLPG